MVLGHDHHWAPGRCADGKHGQFISSVTRSIPIRLLFGHLSVSGGLAKMPVAISPNRPNKAYHCPYIPLRTRFPYSYHPYRPYPRPIPCRNQPCLPTFVPHTPRQRTIPSFRMPSESRLAVTKSKKRNRETWNIYRRVKKLRMFPHMTRQQIKE